MNLGDLEMLLCQTLVHHSMRVSFVLAVSIGCLLTFATDSVSAHGTYQGPGLKTTTIEIPFTSHDGLEMLGKLTISTSGGSHPVVIYVQTAEGMTVDMKRSNGRGGTFNYFDLYREKLPEMNVAFFSYEGRGIRMGEKPPRYEALDWDTYNTSSLENKVRDIMSAVQVVKKQHGVNSSRISDPRKYREKVLKNAPFAALDKNVDGFFTVEEFGMLPNPLRDAVDNENYEVLNQWAKTSAGVTTPKDWFKDQFAHQPIWTFLSKLNIAIGFFHGSGDTNTPISGVRNLEELAKKAGKSKMEFHYFEGLDHSLNIIEYFVKGTLPAGHNAIFEFIRKQSARK